MEMGEWDVDRVAAAMPYPLLLEWQAHNRIRQWVSPVEQSYWQTALITSTIINMTYRGKTPRTYHVDDLTPRIFGTQRSGAHVAQTPKQIYEAFKMAIIGGGMVRSKKN